MIGEIHPVIITEVSANSLFGTLAAMPPTQAGTRTPAAAGA
jgi:hypothetical protein